MRALIKLQDVELQFDKRTILEKINLNISKGVLFGLLGPSGSGKTTLVKLMMGLLSATRGRVYLQDKLLPNIKVLSEVGYMAQADALYKDLTGYENLSFFANIYSLPKKIQKERIQAVVDMVDLDDDIDKMVEVYSGGMLRRLSLAIALLHEPDLLILDEPTVGIDPILRQKIWRSFRELQKKGTTIIITTHVMDEADQCDELVLLRAGQIIAQGSPEEILKSSQQKSLEDAFLYFGDPVEKGVE